MSLAKETTTPDVVGKKLQRKKLDKGKQGKMTSSQIRWMFTEEEMARLTEFVNHYCQGKSFDSESDQ